ncbi:MAG TPA: UdgX family uracil-DNA binding protein [Burkholderiales bacterium]|nr:UdgX family uracil-DNA binding protein [Burkholderiales bacterium]
MAEAVPRQELQQCRRCSLWARATQAVGGEGDLHAQLMLVGEQPGQEEDLAGRPFVGPAGRLLDRALNDAGLDRERVYLTNAVKHFKWEPRGTRRMHKTPAQREIEACEHWLKFELARIEPRVVVALGATAGRALLGGPVTISVLRGQPIARERCWIVVTYHPSAVLRVPERSRQQELYRALVEDLHQAAELVKQKIPES